MRISLSEDPESKPGEILVRVKVSVSDDLPKFMDSHSFKYKVPAGMDSRGNIYGEITVYNASDEVIGTYSFDLERCHNQKCKNEPQAGCPGNTNRLLVANVFHTKPGWQALHDFGTALFKALFGEHSLKNELNDSKFRILIELDGVELDAIPWEYARNGTVFLVRQCRFVRLYSPQDPIPILHPQEMPKLPLRIVAAVPDPIIPSGKPGANLPDLHLGDQIQNFINGFTEMKKAVNIERVFPTTVSQIIKLLRNKPEMSTVFHFMGHCGKNEDGDTRALIFEHDHIGELEYLNPSDLVIESDKLRLAFLSACNTRDISRILVKHGVPYTIGSNCDIPDDLARTFECKFYNNLASGATIEKAMYRTRRFLGNSKGKLQADYFVGAVALYISTVREDDGAFECGDGEPTIEFHMPPNNLTELESEPNFQGYKEELAEIHSHFRRMVDNGTQLWPIYTIKGNIGQDRTAFAAEATRRMAYLFPGGIFAWTFGSNRGTTSTLGYLERLVEVLFSKKVWSELKEQHGSNVEKLGLAIIERFRGRATCLFILDHIDILDIGVTERNLHAIQLRNWFEQVRSVRASIKILLTSRIAYNSWGGGITTLKERGGINSGENGYTSSDNIKDNIHQYFEFYSETINLLTKGCFYGVPPENKAFIDRDKQAEIIAALYDNSLSKGCKILALSGPGGVGKTELMLRYCYLNRNRYDFIFWLRVDSWSTAIIKYRILASQLGLDEKTIKEKDSEEIIRWVLNWFEQKEKWLLCLDNADGDEMNERISELLPRVGGHIIITTRMNIPTSKATIILVDEMQTEEATALLSNVPINEKLDYTKDIEVVVTELGCMPLVIILVRSYIKQISYNLEEYLKIFKDRKKLFSDEDISYQHERTLAIVLMLSFELIEMLNPTAAQILYGCTFLYPENIPVNLFKQQLAGLLLAPSSSAVPVNEQHSKESIEEAIGMLVDFSLLTRTTEEVENATNDVLAIHPLVQEITYKSIENIQKLRWARNLFKAINKETHFYGGYDYPDSVMMDVYFPHIHYLVTLLGGLNMKQFISKDLGELLGRTVLYISQRGMYFEVGKLVHFSTRILKVVSGSKDKHNMNSLVNHAVIYYYLGINDKLESLYQQALIQGRYNQVELLKELKLKISENLLKFTDPNTMSLISNPASLYYIQDKFDEMELLLKKLITVYRELAGSEHQNSLVLRKLLGLFQFPIMITPKPQASSSRLSLNPKNTPRTLDTYKEPNISHTIPPKCKASTTGLLEANEPENVQPENVQPENVQPENVQPENSNISKLRKPLGPLKLPITTLSETQVSSSRMVSNTEETPETIDRCNEPSKLHVPSECEFSTTCLLEESDYVGPENLNSFTLEQLQPPPKIQVSSSPEGLNREVKRTLSKGEERENGNTALLEESNSVKSATDVKMYASCCICCSIM